MEQQKRTPEFLKAAEKLLPLLKAIPKEAIKRHNLLFEKIIQEMMDEHDKQYEHKGNIPVSIEFILAAHLPYYLMYGKKAEKI